MIIGAALAAALVAILVLNRIPDAEAPDGGPPTAELLAENLTLFEGPGAAARVGFDPADPSARLIVRLEPDTASLRLCPLGAITDDLPPLAACRDAASGVREAVTRSAGLGAVAIVLEGAERATADVRIEFAERTRAIEVRLPRLPEPPPGRDCSDNACNPFFELLPARGGDFRASARWEGDEGRLALLQGRVRARSFTATGIPYRVPAEVEGASPLRIASKLSAPGEYALAFSNPQAGSAGGAFADVVLEVSWP